MQATKQAFVQLTTAFAGWQLLLTTKQRHTAITATQQVRRAQPLCAAFGAVRAAA
jgi:hypothetical protein